MKLLRISLGVFAALVVVLVVHIYVATHKAPMHNEGIQLARIDMMAPVDSTQAATLKSAVRGMPGVKNCYMNIPQGTLVYAYQLGKQDKHAVYAQVASISPVPCIEYMPSAKEMTSGCPVMDHSSLEYRFANWIRSWS